MITSSKTPIYNCIAWAADEIHQWWEYGAKTLLGAPTFWPPGYPPGDTWPEVANLFIAFLRYAPTSSRRPRAAYDRVAIYGLDDKTFTHIARQLKSGRWSSKLGEFHDLEHTLTDLEGTGSTGYGLVRTILERGRP